LPVCTLHFWFKAKRDPPGLWKHTIATLLFPVILTGTRKFKIGHGPSWSFAGWLVVCYPVKTSSFLPDKGLSGLLCKPSTPLKSTYQRATRYAHLMRCFAIQGSQSSRAHTCSFRRRIGLPCTTLGSGCMGPPLVPLPIPNRRRVHEKHQIKEATPLGSRHVILRHDPVMLGAGFAGILDPRFSPTTPSCHSPTDSRRSCGPGAVGLVKEKLGCRLGDAHPRPDR